MATTQETARAVAGGGTAAAHGAADWLSLAAAPTFLVMALLTFVHGSDGPGAMCLAASHASPLTGMLPMYLLMSAFHAAPWLKLVSRLGRGR